MTKTSTDNEPDDETSSTKDSQDYNFIFQSGEEVLSNLPLQMSLYFNVVFLPIWLIITLTMLYIKYDCMSSIYRFIVILVFTCLIVTEFVRLYLGYTGNLSERIPELAGFWVLSLLLQFPLHIFVLFSAALHPFPIERVTESVMLVLLMVQLWTGFRTLRKCAYYQAQRFQLQYGSSKILPSSPG